MEKSFKILGMNATYAHIIPKSEQSVLTMKQDVVHHPGNIVPTIDPIHEQMELHHALPGFTIVFLHHRPDRPGKDVYSVFFAPHITGDHILLKFLVTQRRASRKRFSWMPCEKSRESSPSTRVNVPSSFL